MFAGFYLLAFFVLVTFYSRFEFPTFPADILINKGFVLYLPFGSSLAFALFAVVMIETYTFFKHV